MKMTKLPILEIEQYSKTWRVPRWLWVGLCLLAALVIYASVEDRF
jgi:hypothetical protein